MAQDAVWIWGNDSVPDGVMAEPTMCAMIAQSLAQELDNADAGTVLDANGDPWNIAITVALVKVAA